MNKLNKSPTELHAVNVTETATLSEFEASVLTAYGNLGKTGASSSHNMTTLQDGTLVHVMVGDEYGFLSNKTTPVIRTSYAGDDDLYHILTLNDDYMSWGRNGYDGHYEEIVDLTSSVQNLIKNPPKKEVA